MHVPKLLKEELGGGKKEFSLADGKFQKIHQPSVSVFLCILSTYHLSIINHLQEEILSISRRPKLFSAAQTVRASCFTSSTLSARIRVTAWPRWPSGRARLSVRITVLLNHSVPLSRSLQSPSVWAKESCGKFIRSTTMTAWRSCSETGWSSSLVLSP